MCKLGFKEAEEPEIKLPICLEPWRKQRSSKNKKKSDTLTTLKLTAWFKTNCGKFLKRWEYQTTLPVSWETCIQVKKQQLEPDMDLTGSKLREEYDKTVYCYPAYLTSMQKLNFTSCEMLGWVNHKLESRFPGEISTASDMQMTPL